MTRRLRRHRRSLGVGAALLLVGVVALLGLTTPTPASSANLDSPAARTTATTVPAGPPVVGGIVTCPAGDPVTDTCAAMPCPSGRSCGTVVAGPTSNLGPDQFVYLNFSGFAPGDNGITMYYCADPGGGSTLSGTAPVCGDALNQKAQFLQTFPATSSSNLPPGTTEATVQAAEVSPPSTAIPGQQYHPTVASNGFYCDSSGTYPCSIVITDATINSNPTSTSLNSVEIPISFAPSTNGYPNAPVVSTESEFGIDVLMPELARLSCANDPSTAVIPFETATDGLQAVTDLASGQQQIAFTDDPEAADQQAQLKKGNFALIPVAVTANVVGFFSQLNVVNAGLLQPGPDGTDPHHGGRPADDGPQLQRCDLHG